MQCRAGRGGSAVGQVGSKSKNVRKRMNFGSIVSCVYSDKLIKRVTFFLYVVGMAASTVIIVRVIIDLDVMMHAAIIQQWHPEGIQII